MSGESPYDQDEVMRLGKHYQQYSTIRRQRKEHTPKETKFDLPYFYGKDNVENTWTRNCIVA